MNKLTKEEAISFCPKNWKYSGYWDGLYHYFTGKTGKHINLSVSLKHIQNGMLQKCAKRILDI